MSASAKSGGGGAAIFRTARVRGAWEGLPVQPHQQAVLPRVRSGRELGWSQLWLLSVRSCRQRQSFELLLFGFLGKQITRVFSFPLLLWVRL